MHPAVLNAALTQAARSLRMLRSSRMDSCHTETACRLSFPSQQWGPSSRPKKEWRAVWQLRKRIAGWPCEWRQVCAAGAHPSWVASTWVRGMSCSVSSVA